MLSQGRDDGTAARARRSSERKSQPEEPERRKWKRRR